jgi:molybdate transport system substrate-binding protein
LHLLCAGAVQGLVAAIETRFQARTGARIVGRFGAVGAMQEALLGGEPCDVLVVTEPMIAALRASRNLRPESAVILGTVRTGLAVRADAEAPDVADGPALAAALRAAPGIYYPDPLRATAGRHFAKVLRRLGLEQAVAARCHTFANGAAAMRALAASQAAGCLGCTQVSEIIATPGLRALAVLPPGYELVTSYAGAITEASMQATLAAQFLALLGSDETRVLRERCGIEDAVAGA